MATKQKQTTKKGLDAKSTIAITVAIIGVCGTVCAAFITALFGFMSIQSQVKTPINATQTAEARNSSSSSNSSSQTNDLDWTNFIEVNHIPLCDFRVLPDNLNYNSGNVGEQIAKAFENDRSIWAEVPYVIDEFNQTADILFDIRNTSSQDWVEVSKTVDISIDVQSEIPAKVDVLHPIGCGGGGEIRYFPNVNLDDQFSQYTETVTFEDFDYFTLQLGEFEQFLIPFTCTTPGYYRLTLSIPINIRDEAGEILSTTSVLCPSSFVLWDFDPVVNTVVAVNSYTWDGSTYTIDN